MYETNVKMKSQSQSLALCALRNRDRRSTEIAISADSYLKPAPSTRRAIARYVAPEASTEYPIGNISLFPMNGSASRTPKI
eukprot:2165761-Pleurochrysis_carterae.AAC.1